MGTAVEIGSKVLPVILLILLGVALRRTGYLSPEAVGGMKRIAVEIILPLVIFASLAELDFRGEYLIPAAFVLLISTFLLGVGEMIRRFSRSENHYLPALFTSYENGMMGYGILAVVFGQNNIYPIVILDLGQTVFFSLIFVTWIRSRRGEVAAKGGLLLSFPKNPYVIATVLAVALNVTGGMEVIGRSPPLNAVLESIRLLTGLATPLMCLVIGYEIKLEQRTVLPALKVVALRLLILLPTAVAFDRLIIRRLLGLEELFSAAVITMFMLPPFFVGALLIPDDAERERGFALNVISLHIVVFLLLFSAYIVNTL